MVSGTVEEDIVVGVNRTVQYRTVLSMKHFL